MFHKRAFIKGPLPKGPSKPKYLAKRTFPKDLLDLLPKQPQTSPNLTQHKLIQPNLSAKALWQKVLLAKAPLILEVLWQLAG